MRCNTVLGLFSTILLTLLFSCAEDDPASPVLQLRSNTGIDFNNILTYSDSINPYTYRNFYNGSGLAIGDLDNDGLDDVFFTGNQVDNKIYKNLGDLKFEDVTASSGLASEDSWSTGACMVDVNGDNLLDIYVCKAGPPGGANRKNQLFINQGGLVFKDEAEAYGLDIMGLSIQALFFDYDLDGDLDCYLLNNSLKSVGGYDLREGQRNIPSDNGNKFFENIDGKYIDKTTTLGIYSSDIGFGLGVMIVDINSDNYPDIYVANDFFEKDYLYINQKGRGFKELGEEYFSCFPLGSMGVDVADINNDLKPDIFVAEMLPATLERRKTKTIFDTWEKYQHSLKKGYYHQMPRNMLYLNQYPNDFAEVSRMYDCNATEWSWAPLIFDIDNDGYKDLFVSNGVGRDLLDRDYLAYMADDAKVAKLIREDKNALSKLIDRMPESKVQNAIFRNDAGQGLENVSKLWSDMPVSVSNASAYSDLDKDGDIDLVVANVNDEAFVLENTTTRKSNWIGFDLEGVGKNINAIGATIFVFGGGKKYMVRNIPQRGFQSSVSPSLHLGLGEMSKLDSVIVKWPDGTRSKYTSLELNQYNVVKEAASKKEKTERTYTSETSKLAVEVIDRISLTHSITGLNDFNKDPLSIHMVSQSMPSFTITNLDNDKQSEIIIAGAKDIPTEILNIELSSRTKDIFEKKKYSSVIRAYSKDIDKDDDMDIYLAHGSRMFTPYSSELNDILLINEGAGDFKSNATGLDFPKPLITSSVAFGDIDQNGYEDIFVTEGLSNNTYGMPGSGYLFLNQGQNNFELLNSEELKDIGMMKTSAMGDLDGDGIPEIIIAGEWMGIEVLKYQDNKVINATRKFNLNSAVGLWNTIRLVDLDKDGDLDVVAGNIGLNSVYKKKMKLTVSDLDKNGKPEQIVSQEIYGEYLPIHDFDEVSKQLPVIRKKYPDYASYSSASMKNIFGDKNLKGTELELLETSLFINENGTFEKRSLPREIQYSSIHAIETMDVNGDGVLDIILGGNHYNYKPQFGRDDASSGWVLLGTMENGNYKMTSVFPLGIEGEIRTIKSINDTTAMVGIVDQDILKYKIKVNHE